ncbi:MAG: universal stress protein [Flavobacteriaceae bacterium]|nr:universal stress protein [Flavobacteriaceae bacterium]
MQHILLPTDLSDNSKNAIRYALELFSGKSCSFYFLNVQKNSNFVSETFMSEPDVDTMVQSVTIDYKQRLKEFALPIMQEFEAESYTFKVDVEFEPLCDSINQLIITENIDLLVIGSHGTTGAKEVLFGSTTLRVIRNVACPMLVIPEGRKFKGLNSILFTAGSCRDIKNPAAKPLLDLIHLFNPHLHLLKLKARNKGPLHDCDGCVMDVLKDLDYESHTLRGIPIPLAVDAYMQLNRVDIQALFVLEESILDRFMFGSETEKIVYASPVPLLLLPKTNP